MRRREFTIGLLLAATPRTGRAQEPAKQRRIAIVIASGPVTRLNDPRSHAWQAFWAELRRLGDVEVMMAAERRPQASPSRERT